MRSAHASSETTRRALTRAIVFALAAGTGVLGLLAGCVADRDAGGVPEYTGPRGMVERTITVQGATHAYAVWVPPGVDLRRPVPLIVFLHGKGECGTDGLKQTAVGIGPALTGSPGRWPAIVLLPQKPDFEKQWEEFDPMVTAQIEALRAEFHIDPARTVITGLSQGGHGTWTLGALHPDRWAALVPICGYGDPEVIAPKVAAMPVWAFHGGKDDVVPPQQTQAIVDALRRAGGSPKFTLYPDANHNSWDRAYGEPELPAWLFAQRRVPR